MRGTYVLIIHVPYELVLSVGELGARQFKAGFYAYVGSALGGLEKRVERHFRKDKRIHWHIDYLLTKSRAVDVVYSQNKERKECAVAKELAKTLPSVHGFGSSDCNCDSHLFYNQDFNELLRRILAVLKACGLKPMKGVSFE